MNYAMCAGTPGKDRGQYDDNGIVPGHAYTLISAKEVTDKNGEQVRIVQMRNPWKEGEWKGRFSDNSDDWTDQLKKECNVVDENDGLFWMLFEDCMQVMDTVDICKYDDYAQYSFMKIPENPQGFALVKFTVPRNCNKVTTFAVSQRGCRTEQAEGNHDYDQNSYSRRVKVGFAKVTDPK